MTFKDDLWAQADTALQNKGKMQGDMRGVSQGVTWTPHVSLMVDFCNLTPSLVNPLG